VESSDSTVRRALCKGLVIPASPLALTAERKLDERRQRALWRYYIAAGSGGIAIGVHTTQFAIRDPKIGLFRPLLELGKEEMDRAEMVFRDLRVGPRSDGLSTVPATQPGNPETNPLVRIGGCCGQTDQATCEAALLRDLGYSAALLSLAAMKEAGIDELISHCRAIADVIPIIGFYLQPAVGGRVLPYEFWRRFAEIENVVAIKMAPFNRYYTIDVVRAVAESGRDDIALYTGNDDNIVLDLLTPFRFSCRVGFGNPTLVSRSGAGFPNPGPKPVASGAGFPNPAPNLVERRIVGGLLGHWSVWVKRAVELLDECHEIVRKGEGVSDEMLRLSVEVTDCNAAFFDTSHAFAGCIAGLHEVLRRQGLLEGLWCLDPNEGLSSGQLEEIDRVYAAYPHLNDDDFVAAHLDEWLND